MSLHLPDDPQPDPLFSSLRGVAGRSLSGSWLAARPAPATGARAASVLMLFGRGTQAPRTPAGRAELERLHGLGVGDVDVVLLKRASTLRKHAGQVAFPGGGRDPEDADAVAAALREAWEETGVTAGGIRVAGSLEPVYVPVSRFEVTPVLAWWETPMDVRVVDRAESQEVYRVPIADLVAPGNRGRYAVPGSRFYTPAFDAGVLTVWGVTAGLLDFALDSAGWARPYDKRRAIEMRP